VNESVNAIRHALETPGPALAAIQNVQVRFAERKDLVSAEGCRVIHVLPEFGQGDVELNQIVREDARRERELPVEVPFEVLTQAKN
jgi:hypothetical protein